MRWNARQSDDFTGFEAAAPDLTEPIMRRLGFERINMSDLRRQRRRRWGGRLMVLCGLAGMAWLGAYAHSLSSRARVPVQASLPAALDSTLADAPGRRVGETIQRVGVFLSDPGAADPPPTRAVLKPLQRPNEQQSRIPVSESW